MSDYSPRQMEIIQSAGKIITETGVSSLTTKKLSKALNFSESALYRHFASKNEIILAMLHYLATDMDTRYSAYDATGKTPLEHLRFIFTSQTAFFVQKPFFIGVIFPDGLLKESNDINDAIKNIMAIRKKHLMAAIVKCQQENTVRADLSADEISHIMMGSFRLLTLKWQLSDFQFDIAEAGEKLLSNLLKIIQPCKN